MKIIKIEVYKDGGTVTITTDMLVYAIDRRLKSKTKGRIFLGYPQYDGSNIIDNSDEIEKEILDGLVKFDFTTHFYKNTIISLIKELKCKFNNIMFDNLTLNEFEILKKKAQKYDELEDEISKFYINTDGDYDENNPEREGDLCTIGELICTHFGYL